MRRGALIGLASLALAGCGGEVPEQKELATASMQRTLTQSRPAPATLAGQWRVAAIDGEDFNEPYGLALAANDNEIWWEPRCAFHIRSYRITGDVIAFGPRAGAVPPPGTPPPPVCLIAPPKRLADVMRALDAAETVARTPENGVRISGGGHNLLLFSQ